MDILYEWLARIRTFFDFPIIGVAGATVTLWAILQLILFLLLLFYATGLLKRRVLTTLLARTSMSMAGRQAVTTILGYLIIALGLFIILQTAGIDLTTLNVLAGAVGIGIGFGLQNIANNFISGVIILFERPIKVGDRIEVGDVEGQVVAINARATTVITNDNIAILVPNAAFINENVVNWSYNDDQVRFKVPVSVAYGSDTRLVERLLIEVGRECKDVLTTPPPAVRFMEFGESGLHFELRVWSSTLVHRKGVLVSMLNFAIDDKFRANDIEIPFPQRDLHIRSGLERLLPRQPSS